MTANTDPASEFYALHCPGDTVTECERAAFNQGFRKAQSLTPGRPRVGASTFPTAAERTAYIDGWNAAYAKGRNR